MKRFCLITLLILAGCAAHSPSVNSTPTLQVVRQGEMPPPDGAYDGSADRGYVISPFDRLSIDVLGIAELSKDNIQVDAAGHISLPLTGEIEAAGKTPQQLATLLQAKLKNSYVRNPVVAINMRESNGHPMTVEGEVREPGMYPVSGKMTLLRAVAAAKGLTEYARLEDVVVFRTVNNRRMAGLYSLKSIRRGAYDDPAIYPDDVVVVGDSPARHVFKDILQASPLLTAPFYALLVR
jgi:polysaccharide export outer membrane protein